MKNKLKWHACMVCFAAIMYRGLPCYAQAEIKVQVASVVAGHFETVVYSDSRFLLNIKVDNTRDDSLIALRLPFVEMIAGLTALGPTAEADIERNYTSLIAGANEFRMPSGLGIVGSRKCYVGVREDGVQPNLTSDFSHATYESVGHRQVWRWSLPPNEGDFQRTPMYAAQIGGHYLLMANNVGDFQVMADALTAADKAVPIVLGSFDRDGISKHQYWAYRVVQRANAKDAEAAGLTRLNAEVISISFYADIAKRAGFIQVLSSDLSMKLRPKVLPDADIRLQPGSGGMWVAAIPLAQDRVSLEALTALFSSFGFGLAL